MPIKIPATLPAHDVLRSEGVMVMSDEDAARQDIRPLQIALLNLMPMKIETETHFARLIGATPLQIDLTLIRMSEHQSRHTAPEHMEAFYHPFEDVQNRRFDGLITTGAPIELLDFNEVSYWDELERIFDWTQTNVHSTMAVCWSAQAMLNHFHGIAKHPLDAKAFGAFRHNVHDATSPYLRGFSDNLVVPVSRWTEVHQADVDANSGLKTLISSPDAGPCLIEDEAHRALYMFNHLEYDSDTLKGEYDRDVAAGKTINVPMNYYPDDNPENSPENRWRSHAHLLYGNWINQIYQTTPFGWTS
ncbi:homoserine O-succinyltransferase [Monaibacterium marinum]|uniref:Homoserine O-acetyltransferase n=1 Tax=Pontivivens marinum TaxID=1690039 RepID=A0A2C9CSR8_9RHOB|nr:homoserine O-succinyltransferase [Monaibacterium marinum]SOH94551.1 homoserine O-succinyltransferase [Monaibacterium marinum]